ncbi:hypothetical protein Q7P37_004458 [Cladosporium fusiforme]
MDANGSHRGVKRRRADSYRPPNPPARSMSHSSTSNSSDIQVAPVHSSSARPQSKRPVAAMPITATCGKDGVLRVQGVHALLRHLQDPSYRRLYNQGTNLHRASADNLPIEASRRVSHADSMNGSTLIDDDDGPNHKGTYSKTYVLKHPEVTWVHRGQGRYLPTSSVSRQEPRAQSSFTPQSKPAQTPRFSGRSSLRRASGDVDADDDDDQDPTFNSQPPSKRLSDASYSLRRRQSEAEPITPGALRAARINRRSGPFGNADGDEDLEQGSDFDDEYDDMDRPFNRTFPKSYVDEHPEFEWRHRGNGFYRKGARLSGPPSVQSSRRGSNRSQVKDEMDQHQEPRYHASQLGSYPDLKFVHRGNGWYKIDPSSQEAPDQSAIESGDDEPETGTGKFSKEEMIAYKNQHPDTQFIHRGNGRYVMADDLGSAVQTPAAKIPAEDAGQTFSKLFVKQHPGEDFYHAGSGRYRRGSRPAHRPSDSGKKAEVPEKDLSKGITNGLVDKAYVLANPGLEFHHRGQGRYAFGPRPRETPSAAKVQHADDDEEEDIEDDEEEEDDDDDEEMEDEEEEEEEEEEDHHHHHHHVATSGFGAELVDSEYVRAHPNETFHHRGQGRWARGLPPPGSSNKTAVRGPGSSTAKFSATPSNQPIENLPGLDELLIRSEGPDKFPQVPWHYRGGGKWARSSKKKEPVAPKGGNRARQSRGKSLTTSLESPAYQRVRYPGVVYTDDEDDDPAVVGGSFQETPIDSRRPSLNGTEFVGAPMERRRRTNFSQHEEFDDLSKLASKNSSQKSKTATPKPQRLTLEEDRLSDDENFPNLYANSWPQPSQDEPFDAAARLMRTMYKPLNSPDLFVNALTRKDVALRPKEVLQLTTAHVQKMLLELQDEYLQLDKITAPHARIARKPVKGGRVPFDNAVWEDKKEADLYDYNFDSRKVGYQDPDAQRIIRDAEGRELRKRRNRNGLDVDHAATTGGEEAALAPRRAVKPVSRFDGVAQAPTRKKRTATGALKAASETPDPTMNASASQPQALPGGYVVRTSGRWKNHIPKRIRELRGDSVGAPQTNGQNSPGIEEGATRSETPGTSSDTPAGGDSKDGSPGPVRKGRPKGSKNLHKRRDAGIPKGPRKPKVVASIESASSSAQDQPRPAPIVGMPREERNDPWARLGSSRIGYPFD